MAPEGTVDTSAAVDSTPAATGSSTATPGSSGSSGNPTPSPKWEDEPRTKGMLSDLQKERKARQDFEAKFGDLQKKIEEREQQIQSLVGFRAPSKEEADLELIRERLKELVPAANLTPEQLEKFEALLAQSDELAQATEHHWFNHSTNMLNALEKEVTSEIGTMTDRAKKRLFGAYVQAAQEDPEFLRKHDAGDLNQLKQFVKEWIEDFVEPARRKAVATEVARNRLVPEGKSRTFNIGREKPIDVTDNKAVEDLLVSSRKGQFGRR